MIIWRKNETGDALTSTSIERPTGISEAGISETGISEAGISEAGESVEASPSSDAGRDAGGALPLLYPAATPRSDSTSAQPAIGVLLVPPDWSSRVTLNGCPLDEGAHLVRHTDRLDFGSTSCWLAASSEAEETVYEREIHGSDQHCARTRARLESGVDRVVICPGAGCGLLYLARAWALRTPCHQCGFDPARPTWTPRVPVRIDDVESLVKRLLEPTDSPATTGTAP